MKEGDFAFAKATLFICSRIKQKVQQRVLIHRSVLLLSLMHECFCISGFVAFFEEVKIYFTEKF